MSALSFLYRNGLWIAPPLFVVGALLLGFSILNVVRLGERNRILSAPLREKQDIEFADTGRVVLCVEGPLLTRRFSNLVIQLNTGDGIPVEGHRSFFRTSSSSFSKVRTERQSYEIPYRGRYILYIKGLGAAQASDADHRIVFMKPHLSQAIGFIIGILLAAALTVGSVVLFFLRLTSRG